ncbi:MAG: phosphotransferase enzyme family protein [Thermoguttaceae bacterium]
MDLREILSHYPLEYRPFNIEALGFAGGFSGAFFWRMETPAGKYCLRRWPREHPSEEGVRFIHALLRHVWTAGFPFVPVPRATRDGRSYLSHAGHFWELTPWMPGVADFRLRPTAEKLRAALTALANFHRAAASFPMSAAPSTGRSPGIGHRTAQLRHWMGGELAALERSLEPAVWPELFSVAKAILALVPTVAPRVLGVLEKASPWETPLQPCLGDIWHGHVLFQGDRVTGLVDFGSVRVESVAVDVARLLGSMAVDDKPSWQSGIDAYQSIRPLSPTEVWLVEAFDRSTVVMSGLNWIDWIYRERRTFPDRESIVARLKEILLRLQEVAK